MVMTVVDAVFLVMPTVAMAMIVIMKAVTIVPPRAASALAVALTG